MFEPVFGRYSIHTTPDEATYILDTQKAPLWTIAPGLAFVRTARAPRKTVVIGTISDYANNAGRTYRKVARNALEVAQRVVLVGAHSVHVARLREENLQERLFAFQSTYEASAFLAKDALPGELLYVKASLTDHLERIMLSKQVVCWRERCGKNWSPCPGCPEFRRPHQPPMSITLGHACLWPWLQAFNDVTTGDALAFASTGISF